jgi:hypothetical protein
MSEHETLFATAYQVVGAADGPEQLLDNLAAAASGRPLPHDPGAGLPWTPSTKLANEVLDLKEPELRGMFERILAVARSPESRVVGNIELADRLIKAVRKWRRPD